MKFKSSRLSINRAFTHLRGMIPTEPVDRKLSKIEVLRLATSYIQHLVNQLNSGTYVIMIEKNTQVHEKKRVSITHIQGISGRPDINQL